MSVLSFSSGVLGDFSVARKFCFFFFLVCLRTSSGTEIIV